ncbi:MAG TPA: hypothetical protein VF531_05380 [Bacillota bacterium]
MKGNTDVRCERPEPVYISPKYIKIKEDRLKYLEAAEITKYLTEREEMGIRDCIDTVTTACNEGE